MITAPEVAKRLKKYKQPKKGGRIRDISLTITRLVNLKPGTLKRLERLAVHFSEPKRKYAPMQIAAALLEMAVLEMEFKQKGIGNG